MEANEFSVNILSIHIKMHIKILQGCVGCNTIGKIAADDTITSSSISMYNIIVLFTSYVCKIETVLPVIFHTLDQSAKLGTYPSLSIRGERA